MKLKNKVRALDKIRGAMIFEFLVREYQRYLKMQVVSS